MSPGNGNPLNTVPPLAAFVAVTAVFAAGVLIGGIVGALVLGALAVLVATLLAASWPRLRPPERALRVVVLIVLVAIAISVAA